MTKTASQLEEGMFVDLDSCPFLKDSEFNNPFEAATVYEVRKESSGRTVVSYESIPGEVFYDDDQVLEVIE